MINFILCVENGVNLLYTYKNTRAAATFESSLCKSSYNKITAASPNHHPYFACVSALVSMPFARRSASFISFCFISKYNEPI
jgi:hypothetical protein